MTKRLIIDLARCDQCEECGVSCGFYDCRPDNDEGAVGPMLSLREKATFELVCRRCEHASCIVACPFDALEKTDDGVIKRHNLRCVSCKSCAIACPFGTIYQELLPFYSMSYENSCSVCLETVGAAHGREQETASLGGFLVPEQSFSGSKPPGSKNPGALEPVKTPEGRLSVRGHGPLQQQKEPPCVGSCREGALEYREIEPEEAGIHIIDQFLAAKTQAWVRAEQAGEAAP